MKRSLVMFAVAASFLSCLKVSAQNADEIIYNAYQSPYNYVANSFVIDTGTSQTNKKRAFLIWANNLQQDSLRRNFSLSEYDPNLNFLTEQGSTAEKFGSIKNMVPKKVIKSRFAHVYYALSYTTNSTHTVNGLKVFSSPVVYKIDGNTLSVIWAKKVSLSVVTKVNANTVIEFNDLIETSDKNIVLVGKYATNTQTQELVFATKLSSASGAILWRYRYNTGEQCSQAANSVTETSDAKLSITGYVRKCTTTPSSGNNDVFYMELQSNGIPVAGTYSHFIWPSNLNMWGDKITCYTSFVGSDQLIISGYVDILSGNTTDRQILVMNLKQNGALITAQHVGDVKTDVCNDLIFSKNGNSTTDYFIYLTGQTANYNSQATVSAEAYFMYAKFNINSGISGLSELSTFPVSAVPYNTYRSRTGIEIKNAGDYKKFAILATGFYQPTAATSGTYSNMLIRDFNDISGSCIKQQQPPVKQFSFDRKVATAFVDSPSIKVYSERWIKLSKLTVKELCQSIKIDPSRALSLKKNNDASMQTSLLRINPNPVSSVINISMVDGSLLTGKNQNAVIRIYNTAMQAEKVIAVNANDGKNKTIQVADLTPGIYVVQLICGDELISAKFIKE